MPMQCLFVFLAVFCLSAAPAWACAFRDAQYVPDPGDPRPAGNYYSYRLTMEPGPSLVLNIVDPATNKVETRLRMAYQSAQRDGRPAQLQVSKKQSLAPQFLDENFLDVYPHSDKDAATSYIVLHDSLAKFIDLPEEDLDVRYVSGRRVKPGALVNERLELIPDTWVLETCTGRGL